MHQCSTYCFTLSHAPTDYSFFDIGSEKAYLKSTSLHFSKTSISRVLARKKSIKISCYFAGDYLKSLPADEIKSIKKYVSNGQIELLAGTYHHSFTCLLSKKLFQEEIENHLQLINELFEIRPKGFYNTISIFSDDLVPMLIKHKFLYSYAPALEWYMRGIDQISVNSIDPKLKLLILSPSIDSKTMARQFPGESEESIQLKSIQAQDLFKKGKEKHTYALPNVTGRDASNRDLNFYLGNSLQKQVFKTLNSISPRIEKHKNKILKQHFLQLSTPHIFSLLHEDKASKLQHYSIIMSMLSDLELKSE